MRELMHYNIISDYLCLIPLPICLSTEHDLRCAIASCELRCVVASCNVRVRTHFYETCDVRAVHFQACEVRLQLCTCLAILQYMKTKNVCMCTSQVLTKTGSHAHIATCDRTSQLATCDRTSQVRLCWIPPKFEKFKSPASYYLC